MNPYNQRKEPTFGEPSPTSSDKVETVENSNPEEVSAKKLSFSLHTSTSPGHTFTPVMKRFGESAKHLSTLEEKAEQTMLNQKNQQNTAEVSSTKAQNGGFAFAPVNEANNKAPEPQTPATEQPKVAETLKASTPTESVEEKPVTATNSIERVIPVAATPATKAVVEKVPSKYRRLFIVLSLLIALLIVFLLLKPKTPETVESLQQGSSLPIEFRPVDEEEAKRAEAEAKALQEAQAQQQQADQQAQNAQVEQNTQAVTNTESNVATTSTPVTQTNEATPAQVAAEQQGVAAKPAQPAVQPKTEQKVAEPKAVEHKTSIPKPVVQEVAKKPTTSGSVIYQPETATKSPAKPVAPTQPKVESKPVAKIEAQPKAAPVVTAQPVKTAVSSKTMTVPKGVSLMQVFRDHNLNISDVNAMSKVNNIVSNLKVGEKVTVRLDKNNRVTEMSIGSGGKFIRQANGTYIYK